MTEFPGSADLFRPEHIHDRDYNNFYDQPRMRVGHLVALFAAEFHRLIPGKAESTDIFYSYSTL